MMQTTDETITTQKPVKLKVGKSATREAKSLAWRKAKPFVEVELERLAGFGVEDGAIASIEDEPNEKKINRAALAQLRRTLGKKPDEAVPAFPYLARWTDGLQDRWQVECYFLVAALFALHAIHVKQRSWHHDTNLYPRQRNFGASWRKLLDELEKDNNAAAPPEDGDERKMKSLDRRFTTLLVSRREDLPARLRHAVQLLATNDIRVDWVQLLRDLMRWDAGDWKGQSWSKRDYEIISPQRAWAQAFWRVVETDEASDDEPDNSRGADDTDQAAPSTTEG